MRQTSAPSIPDRELSLPEMLADPIVRAVMARDGITTADMEGVIEAMRARLARRPAEHRDTGRRVSRTIASDGRR